MYKEADLVQKTWIIPSAPLASITGPSGPKSPSSEAPTYDILPASSPRHLLPPSTSTTTPSSNQQTFTTDYTHLPTAMPRQKSAGRAPASRAPARPTTTSSYTTPQQQRPATTMAAPPQHAAPPAQHAPAPQASQGPGLFGQMASTAAYVFP